MGWLFTAHQSKADLVRERTAPWQTEEVRGTTLAHCLRGQRLWKVVEIERKASGARERYIALDLLAYQGGAWGYKDLCEAEHPYYYSCPLGYLDLAPTECAAWREGVRAYHRRFAAGQCVRLIRCRIPWVRITQIKPLRGEYGGMVYRLRRGDLGELLTEAAP